MAATILTGNASLDAPYLLGLTQQSVSDYARSHCAAYLRTAKGAVAELNRIAAQHTEHGDAYGEALRLVETWDDGTMEVAS